MEKRQVSRTLTYDANNHGGRQKIQIAIGKIAEKNVTIEENWDIGLKTIEARIKSNNPISFKVKLKN